MIPPAPHRTARPCSGCVTPVSLTESGTHTVYISNRSVSGQLTLAKPRVNYRIAAIVTRLGQGV